MDVNIQEIDSTVHLTEAQNPQLVEAVAKVVLERMKDYQEHQRRVEDERQLWPGVSARQSSDWA